MENQKEVGEMRYHPTRNISPLNSYKSFSNKKVWWVCDKTHEWEAVISDVTKGQKCPYCSNKRILAGYNDIATTNPDLAAQWHPTKNGELTAKNFSSGSRKAIWWQCDSNHIYLMAIKKRKIGQGCPVCAGKKVNLGVNDIATTHPELLEEWHFSKNIILPTEISAGSTKNVWWKCVQGHEWETSPNARGNRSCPVCSNRTLMAGYNDLATTHPDIAAQWHPILNNDLTSDNVLYGSSKPVWWLCSKKHEWVTTPSERTGTHKTNCPDCSNNVSLAEKEIVQFFTKHGIPVDTNNRVALQGLELDIYIPEKKIAIEFNGLYWHSEKFKPKTYHYDKWLACKNKGIQLIQIWEDDWVRNPEQIKSMLTYKVGISIERKVYARKTNVVIVGKSEAEKFLNINHIQGYANGSYYLGLTEKGDIENMLVAVLVLKKEAGTNGKTLNIIRYATSTSVVGGFTKLLTHAERIYRPQSFITFSDHAVSDGGLYLNNGFTVDKELKPDYMYVVQHIRKHKFGYRVIRFKDDAAFTYVEGMTEKELALLNNLPRIWDAGKTRWVKQF